MLTSLPTLMRQRGPLSITAATCICLLVSGCVGNPWSMIRNASETTVATTSSVFGIRTNPGPDVDKATEYLDSGMDLYRRNEFSQASRLFHKVSQGKRIPRRMVETAMFYEGECLRQQRYYPAAAETYSKLVLDFPRGEHHQEALQRMFDIANYWLDETREEMKARNEKKAGKRWFIRPVSFIHVDRTKPLLDMEGRAKALLEKIYLNDIDGPLGEKALFFLGSTHFFRDNYAEADHYFHQVVKFHPNGKFAPRALELSIICKQLIPGGPDYDGRKVAEARELIHQAKHAYPELSNGKGEFLQRQLYTIHTQQAAKDLMIADFYKRTGHPGSAYFYYELVRRRYPGTKYAKTASQRMEGLRGHAVQRQDTGGGGVLNRMRIFGPRRNADQSPEGQLPPTAQTPQRLPGAELGPMPRPR